ncbi:MAG: rRNA maturation RNase YbeY [Patescibacteria group bacterium]
MSANCDLDITFYGKIPKVVTKKALKDAVCAVLKKLRKKQGKVGIAFISEQKIKEFNKKYLKKNKPTDVLSFTYSRPADPFLEGDIMLCGEYIKKQAKANSVLFKQEVLRLAVHGMLHIGGMDHDSFSKEKKMFSLQEKILKTLC